MLLSNWRISFWVLPGRFTIWRFQFRISAFWRHGELMRDISKIGRFVLWLGTALLLMAVALPSFAQSSGQASAQGGTAPSGATTPPVAAAAPSPEDARLLKEAESYIRMLFAWGAAFQVKLGPLTQSPAPDFYRVPIVVT